MKYVARMTAGFGKISGRSLLSRTAASFLFVALLGLSTHAGAQALYKYQGEDGEWIYSDRPPADQNTDVEIRSLTPTSSRAEVKVSYEVIGNSVQLIASNNFHAPVELELRFQEIQGLRKPGPDEELHWVLQPRSETPLISLEMLPGSIQPALGYQYAFLVGDPNAQHRPERPYRLPYAIASNYTVSQAYPDVVTHTTEDSRYAVDFDMPVGTDVFAARGGIVFDMVAGNFKGGTNASRDMSLANIVRILHDDGTYAIYAHLNWNSIRVRVGDKVERGEYIADSGNTGFSSGPHLHFVVVKNTGMAMQSVPVQFAGSDQGPITPATGAPLTAY